VERLCLMAQDSKALDTTDRFKWEEKETGEEKRGTIYVKSREKYERNKGIKEL